LLYLPCLAVARQRHLRQKSIKNLKLRGALQFSVACIFQDKKNHADNTFVVLSRDFSRYWEMQVSENLFGFESSQPTVGIGIAPIQHTLADFTAGRELHPALKTLYLTVQRIP
jgi:hypothetical protein